MGWKLSGLWLLGCLAPKKLVRAQRMRPESGRRKFQMLKTRLRGT